MLKLTRMPVGALLDYFQGRAFYSDILSQSRHNYRGSRVVPLQGTMDLTVPMLPTCSPVGAWLILLSFPQTIKSGLFNLILRIWDAP